MSACDCCRERYGAIVKVLFDRGTPIPGNDIWFAATALCADARLLSRDRHFSLVPGLIVIDWLCSRRIGETARGATSMIATRSYDHCIAESEA